MAECIFKNNPEKQCPVPEGYHYVHLRQTCKDGEYGEACAQIMGQEMVARTYVERDDGYRSDIDRTLGDINAQLQLTTIPPGDAPAAVREAAADTLFPLRENRPVSDETVAVSHTDLYLSLLSRAELVAASWYDAQAQQMMEDGNADTMVWWKFDAEHGEVSELRPHSSLARYDDSFRMGSACLWNSHAPPLLLVREVLDPPGVRSSTQI